MAAKRRQDAAEPAARSAPKRVFTVGEANRALVLVRRIVADVIQEYSRLLELQETLEAAEAHGAAEEYALAHAALTRSAEGLRACLAELDDVGVELKDWSLGAVDFPSTAGGRQVCLSWRYGQERVEHWHEMESSFASLQPLETLPKGRYVGEGMVAAGHRTAKGAGGDLPTD
ncbi:MAG TPA: DUF2203 domain-containing protein [Phycisphaerae bacterium]|nr:DUF2203 domain-containing protein [Phycisphaerae bacterium]